MSWCCSNTCHVITTNSARQIIRANSPLTLPFVEFTDLDGSRFHVDVSDAPCLKIVIDLKDDGGLVLQKIGILFNNLAFVRNETYASDALQQVQCAALCPVPFRVQLSSDVELVVCEACNPCCCPLPQNNDGKYLMLIAFFLSLLALLYFMSLLRKFWRNWYCDCSCSVGCGCQRQNTMDTVASSVVLPRPSAVIRPEPPTIAIPTIKPVEEYSTVVPRVISDFHKVVEQTTVPPSDLLVRKMEHPIVVLSDVLTIPSSDLVISSDVKVMEHPIVVPSNVFVIKVAILLSDVVITSDIKVVELPIVVLSDVLASKAEQLLSDVVAISDLHVIIPSIPISSDLLSPNSDGRT